MKRGVRTLVYLAVLVAQAMVLTWAEGLIPLPLPVPGARVGLANIVTLVAAYTLPWPAVLLVVTARTVLGSFLFAGLSTLLYSLSAGLVSAGAMLVLRRILREDRASLLAVSLIGAIVHNLTQLTVAALVLENIRVFWAYLPWLVLLAIPAGLFVGAAGRLLLRYVETLHLDQR
jgi:heptaprenyl diphosphate synthase